MRLSYDNADSLVRWWIDQYVELSPEQDELVRERLTRFHAWHRQTQLSEYIRLVRQGQEFVAGQPTPGDALTLADGIIHAGMTLAEQAAPDIADLLLTATPDQIARAASRFKRNDAAYAREVRLADGEGGQHDAQFKRQLERAEYWFGEFSDDQRLALRKLVAGQPPATRFWYDERLRRQRDWLALMRLVQRQHPPRERIVQLLREYAAHFDLPNDPARLTQARALRRNSATLLVAIHAMTTPGQRAHARHKLGDLINDFTALSRGE
ncbi:MAG: DUF6279 family lipoprotein [Sterolibacterium sp.]